MGKIETKPRDFHYNPDVEEWREIGEILRDVNGVTEVEVPTWVLLSLIHVESSGDETPDDGGTSFWGLLQIGSSVAADVNEVWGTRYKKEDFAGETKGKLSIEAFFTWAKRYEATHDWDPELLALGWKAGVGTLKAYKAKLARGKSEHSVNKWLEYDRWNSYSYLLWFRDAAKIWKPDEVVCG